MKRNIFALVVAAAALSACSSGFESTEVADFLGSEVQDTTFQWRRKFDFTLNPAVYTLAVEEAPVGTEVTLTLSMDPKEKVMDVPAVSKTAKVGKAGKPLVFDFSRDGLECNAYRTVRVSCSQPARLGLLSGPSDDLVSINLFQRYEGNPVFNPSENAAWCKDHMANAQLLTPKNSPDGGWWMYLRGSGTSQIDGTYHDQIGLFRQSAENFNPFGPWEPYEGNPVIPHSLPGNYDEMYLLDTAPCVDDNGRIYVYYQGRDYKWLRAMCCAWSDDGIHFTKMDTVVISRNGCSDAVYHEGLFYRYAGGVYVNADPSKGGERIEILKKGDGPSHFDSVSASGVWVFRIEGVDKWFGAYQGSASHGDFPDRFHMALSDDLIHWTKVDNDQPMFTRGHPGQWDQGGMWFPEIFEYGDKLYLYYEGWGREGYVPNRDEDYFPGRSCEGAAWCYTKDFLKWCGLK